MLKNLLTKVFGDRHEREARKLLPLVDEINEIAAELQALSDDELKAQTEKFRGIIRERTAELESRTRGAAAGEAARGGSGGAGAADGAAAGGWRTR
jgi:preprotein translocase subunit SecA